MNKMNAVILAAGSSSRMGRAKQVLPLGKKPVLEHVIDTVLAGDFLKVAVVIGHRAETIQQVIHITDSRLDWIINRDYQSGISTSIQRGVDNVWENGTDIMIFLGDLPFISIETIGLLNEARKELKNETNETFIIRPSFQGGPGHPVLFGNIVESFFSEMEGDIGAIQMMRKIKIQRQLPVSDWGILFDIDTALDYKKAQEFLR